MAVVKIWHYAAVTGEEELSKANQLFLEPYADRQQVDTTSGAAASTPSPSGTHLARIEVAVPTKFRVIPKGGSGTADQDDPTLITSPGPFGNVTHCPPGATISFVEAV